MVMVMADVQKLEIRQVGPKDLLETKGQSQIK
jgi:hypothetical protein